MGQHHLPRSEQSPKEEVKEAEPSYSPTEIDRIMARVSSSSGEDAKGLPRTLVEFPIWPAQCLEGVLTEQVKIGIEELDSAQELRAYQAAGGINVSVGNEQGERPEEFSISQQALSVAFGKEALRTLNGRLLTTDERRTLWELFRTNGRLTVGIAYMTYCSGEGAGFMARSLSAAKVIQN